MMASFLPILQEILPMLMPGSVHITKAEELRRDPTRPHHSEDEAEPSDPGEPDEDDVADEDDDEDIGFGELDMDEGDGIVSSTTAWRAAYRGRGPPAERQLPKAPTSPTLQTLQTPKPTSKSPKSPKEPRPPRNGPPASGVTLRDAIVHRSSSLCASVLTVKPRCETVVFHNGEQEAIVYAVSGTAELGTLPDDFDEYDHDLNHDYDRNSDAGSSIRSRAEPAKHTIGAGDFAFIPAWTEHQVRNVDDGPDAVDVVWVVVRNASEPTVVPLEGWGGEAK